MSFTDIGINSLQHYIFDMETGMLSLSRNSNSVYSSVEEFKIIVEKLYECGYNFSSTNYGLKIKGKIKWKKVYC